MSTQNVKSLLFLNSCSSNTAYSILFHCAMKWAHHGNRVLFITQTPLTHLPLKLAKMGLPLIPDVLKIIQFMYLSDWQQLLEQLYSIHLRSHPVSMIIVQNLEKYFQNDVQIPNHEDHVSLICASLLNAASTCAGVLSKQSFLLIEYICENSMVEKNIVKNYFHNVWQLETSKDENEKVFTKLINLSCAARKETYHFMFEENLEESMISLCTALKCIISAD